jgi:hypothetical protein
MSTDLYSDKMGLPGGASKLTLRHLNRAHIELLAAYEGIPCDDGRADAVEELEEHLATRLLHDCVLTPLAGELTDVVICLNVSDCRNSGLCWAGRGAVNRHAAAVTVLLHRTAPLHIDSSTDRLFYTEKRPCT